MPVKASSSTAFPALFRRQPRSTACWRSGRSVLDAAIEIRVDEEALLKRIESRIAETLARGETLRDDDDPQVLHRRLAAYRELTAPLVAYYRLQGVLHVVNGMEPIPQVTAAIDRELTKALAAKAVPVFAQIVKNGGKKAGEGGRE